VPVPDFAPASAPEGHGSDTANGADGPQFSREPR
jgi:hypothetical protein